MERYCVIEDLKFSNNNDKYYISSDKLGLYLKVSKEIYDFMKYVIELIKQNVDLDKIINEDNQNDVLVRNYNKAINFLEKNSIIYAENNKPVKRSTLETELIGHKIFEVQFNEYKKSVLLEWLLILLLLINIPLLIKNIIIIFSTDLVQQIVFRYESFNMVNVINITATIIAIITSIIIHEFSHILFANMFGVGVRSVSMYLFLGFQPVFFVKYRDLLILDKYKKILIYLGGFIANLGMANVSLTLLKLSKHWMFGVFIVVNIFIIIDNLSIINNTDFYYILTELFNITAFKVKVLKRIGLFLNKKITLKDFLFRRENFLGNLYLAIGSVFRIFTIYLFISVIMRSVLNIKYINYISIFLVTIYILFSMKKFLNNIKKTV